MDTTSPTALNAIQVNQSVGSIDEALRMHNLGLQQSAMILGVGGNGRFAAGKDSEANDLRVEIWRQTHLTGAGYRVGLPEQYPGSLEELLAMRMRMPLILDPESPYQAMDIAIGMDWGAAKMKFLREGGELAHVVVESRMPSIQPSAKNNAGIALLLEGNLSWSLANDEPLMPMWINHANYQAATWRGMEGDYYLNMRNGNDWEWKRFSGREMREVLIKRAVKGLAINGRGSEEQIDEIMREIIPEEPFSHVLAGKLRQHGGIQERLIDKEILTGILLDEGVIR